MTDDKRLATGNELAQEICKAIGVDIANVASVVIECRPHEAALITVEKFVTNAAKVHIGKTMALYMVTKHYPPSE